MKYLLPAILALLLATKCGAVEIPADDVVFKALNDEMQRSMTRLQLDKYAKPYFIAYTVEQTDDFGVSASFGAIDSRHKDRKRTLVVDVREGDYSLDSSNSGGGGIRFGLGGPGAFGQAMTVDDNYDAIRHDLWLKTDSAYKSAIESLESKKAFLAETNEKDRPDSMSRETPVVSISDAANLSIDDRNAEDVACKLSAIFKEYPKIQKSYVSYDASADTRWFINSEGFCNRTPKRECIMAAIASAQADDGMMVSDIEIIAAETQDEMPPYAELERRVRGLADRVVKMSEAKPAEEYRGPILFEDAAAAEFFSEALQSNLGHAPEPLNKNNSFGALGKNPLADRLGMRVMPTFLNVVDDPLTRNYDGTKIISAYDIDDEGVKAQKVSLIEKGILKTFCMSRVPTHEIKHSNGHARGHAGVAENLYVISDSKMSPDDLKKRLIELGKEEGLKEVLIARRLWNFGAAALEPRMFMSNMMSSIMAGSEVMVMPPTVLYKVSVEDGHEEQIRGAQFGNLTMRVLRDIDSTSDKSSPYTLVSLSTALFSRGTPEPSTIVTPSIIIKEMEVHKASRQTERKPFLLNPYFEAKK